MGRSSDKITFMCCRYVGTLSNKSTRDLNFLKCPGDCLGVVVSFCYLSDRISNDGGCSESIVSRIRIGWGIFRELLPLLATRELFLSQSIV